MTPKPYYSDDLVTLFHGDCADVLAALGDGSVSAVITDPPYTTRTHGNAKTNRGGKGARKLVNFAPITDEALSASLAECGRVSQGWVIATLDYAQAVRLETEPPPGLRMLRIGVWVKTNPMPCPSGDRPGQGWEAIAFLHREDCKPRWNGGGKSGVWITETPHSGHHPTSKPLRMVSDWVRLFTNRGDSILDPYMGGGTTIVAAVENNRAAIGVERELVHCQTTRGRLAQMTGTLPFDEVGA